MKLTCMCVMVAALTWNAPVNALDCLAYLDADADHNDAISAAEAVYREAMGPVRAAESAFRETLTIAQAARDESLRPALDALYEARDALRSSRRSFDRAESAARQAVEDAKHVASKKFDDDHTAASAAYYEELSR